MKVRLKEEAIREAELVENEERKRSRKCVIKAKALKQSARLELQ